MSASREVCHVIGGGPSLAGFDWRSLDGEFCIVVNDAFRELPRAKVVLFSLEEWYLRNFPGLREHEGLKFFACDTPNYPPKLPPRFLRLELTTKQKMDFRPGRVGGLTTGHMAVNLALNLGFRELWLYGFDMRREGEMTHFHGDALFKAIYQQYEYYRRLLDDWAPDIEQLGARVVNLSANSALRAYPKVKGRLVSKPAPFELDGMLVHPSGRPSRSADRAQSASDSRSAASS